MAHYLLKGSTYLTSLQSCITQQQQVWRNIFAYSDRGGFSLSFGYVYVKFEPGPKKLLAAQDKNLGSQVLVKRWPTTFLKVVPT